MRISLRCYLALIWGDRDQLDLDVLTVWGLVGYSIASFSAFNCCSKWRGYRVDLNIRIACNLAGAQNKLHGVASELAFDEHAGFDDAIISSGFSNFGVFK